MQKRASPIFDAYDQGDPEISKVIDQYTEILGQGIANIVNLFRPQVIILGGDLSEYLGKLIDRIEKIMIENCFGGANGFVPEIVIAQLGKDAGMIGAANL